MNDQLCRDDSCPLTKGRWNPFVVGALIGMLSWATFGLMGKALGASTTMVNVVGLIESMFAPQHVEANAYFAKYVVKKPAIDWQMMLVVGMVIGAFVSAMLGRTYKKETVPDLWSWRFGPSKWKRYLWAFVGGAVMLFGARMAGGCTSGHGISGGLQFAVGSWTFFATFFMTGIAFAFLLYGKAGRDHV